MKNTIPATLNAARIVAKDLRRANRTIDTGPFSRTAGSTFQGGPDDLRLKAALKRAVERDLAPQTLIDAIRNNIRNADEPR